MSAQPEFPITILIEEDGTEHVFDNPTELAITMEWFDSDDPEERARVTDAKGRAVHVKVTKLELLTLELK
jgi:hypothetical protein